MPHLLPELIRVEIEQRQLLGETATRREYLDRFPGYREAVAPVLDEMLPGEAPCNGRRVGRYYIQDEVGGWGMGIVYRALDTTLDRVVALKMIKGVGGEQKARILAEAKAIATLQNSNIVQIYESGEHEREPYLALEYCDGGTLEDQLHGTPQPPRDAAQLVRTLAEAVHDAHRKGIVHRDLKPANVLLDGKGVPKVADFGLAKRLDNDSGQTQSGAIMGTASYMAPEQALGKSKEVGPTADVYALGAVLYECLTGRPPFRGASTLDTLEQVRNHEPVPVRRLQPKVPRNLETICLKCLRKEPVKRYESAQALAEDLRRWLSGEPIQAKPVKAWERLWKWTKRKPAAAVLVAITILALPTILLGIYLYRHQAEETQGAAQAEGMVRTLGRAETGEVPRIMAEMAPYRRWAVPLMSHRLAECEPGSKEWLHLSLVLLPTEPEQIDPLTERLLTCSLDEFPVIRDGLRPHKERLLARLRLTLQDTKNPTLARYRAGQALASYAPDDEVWTPSILAFLGDQLLSSNLDQQRELRKHLAPIGPGLVPTLEARFRDEKARDALREAAAYAMADFARGEPGRLARLACEGTPAQFQILYPHFLTTAEQRNEVKKSLLPLVAEPQADPGNIKEEDRVKLGRRRALVAITLIRLGEQSDAFNIFEIKDDPEALTQFVHECKEYGLTQAELLRGLEVASQLSPASKAQARMAETRPFCINGQKRG